MFFSQGWIWSLPFCWWGNWGSERLSHCHKGTQPLRRKRGFWTLVCLSFKMWLFLYHSVAFAFHLKELSPASSLEVAHSQQMQASARGRRHPCNPPALTKCPGSGSLAVRLLKDLLPGPHFCSRKSVCSEWEQRPRLLSLDLGSPGAMPLTNCL